MRSSGPPVPMVKGRLDHYEDMTVAFCTPEEDEEAWRPSGSEKMDAVGASFLAGYEDQYRLYPKYLVDQLRNARALVRAIEFAMNQLAEPLNDGWGD